MPDLADLPSLTAGSPVALRLLTGAAGAVLLVAGARLYRVAVVLPGFLLGVGLGAGVAQLLTLDPMVGAGVALVAGLIGAVAAHLVERFAVVIAGVIGGLGAAQVVDPLVAAGGPPWWVWPVAAVTGGLVFPLIWKAALLPLTAWIGAVVLIDAAGLPPSPLYVGGLAVVGLIVQASVGRGKKAD
jgi:uncharacterized membrane protein